MYRVIRTTHFSYGHRLVKHAGKCSRLHGHNAAVEIELSSLKLDDQAMVVDFDHISATIGRCISETLDHRMILWEHDPALAALKQAGEPVVVLAEHPTAETLAKLIFEEARSLRLPVSKVTLWETPHSAAVYYEG